ncbi:MAG: type IV secretory system conjugative DNA transfer family protein [Clostridia bacterium]|nr:type IV secretory system conjugative DNA transfer family protein [Clostridia bacterium]
MPLIVYLVSGALISGIYKFGYASALKDTKTLYFALVLFIILTVYLIYTSLKSFSGKGEKKVVSGQKQDKNVESILENSAFMTDSEMKNEFSEFTYESLKDSSLVGVPVKAVEKEEYKVTLSSPNHTLIIGTTGSGKTTSYINPLIEILSQLGSKPSLIIGDVKGELLSLHRKELEKKGYKILVLDLRNPYESSKWNPLESSFLLYKKMLSLDKEITLSGTSYLYKGKAYETKEDALKKVRTDKKKIYDEVYDNLNDIAVSICPVENKEDPTWEKGARNFILAILLAMLEDLETDGLNMTTEKFNFYNLYSVATSNEDNCRSLTEYFATRPPYSKAQQLSKQVLVSAEKTRDSYLTTAYSKLSVFADTGICSLTSSNETDINILQDFPAALFLEIPDEKETRHPLASLFIAWAYKELVALSRENKDLALKRDVVFILDEFGNLPRIDKMSQMVTVGRSRRIWFYFVIQSYTQLEHVYGERISGIIKSNCNVQVFIGTSDQKTVDEYSKRCGNMSVITRSYSQSTGKKGEFSDSASIKERPVIYPSELQTLNSPGRMGNAVITVFGYKPIKTSFTPSFSLKAFTLGGGEEPREEREVFDEKEIFYDIKRRKEIVRCTSSDGLTWGEMKLKKESDGALGMSVDAGLIKEKASVLVDLINEDYITGVNMDKVIKYLLEGDFKNAVALLTDVIAVFDHQEYLRLSRMKTDRIRSIYERVKKTAEEIEILSK